MKFFTISNSRIIFLTLTIISVIGLSYILSNQSPFAGDEFYTLDIEKVHKPVPYHFIVSSVIKDIGDIKPFHTFSLRLTSVIFSIIGIILFFIIFPKGKIEYIVLSILLITNPFLYDFSIFFRYYSYYFMASVLAFSILVIGFPRLQINSRIIFGVLGSWMSLSILYVLNAMQFGMSLLFDLANNKIKTKGGWAITIGTILLSIGVLIIKPHLIWQLFYALKITGHAAVDFNSIQVMGLTKATLIKPIYAVFQMMYGPYIAPTHSVLVGVLFILITLLSLFLLYKIWKIDRPLFLRILFSVIIPFFLIYYFFQSLSLPGATQLEPKHGMLLFPLLIFLVIKSHRYFSPLVSFLFIGCVLSAQIMGLNQLKQKENPNWNYIAKTAFESLRNHANGLLLMDGRSRGIFEFYSQDYSHHSPVAYTWETFDTLEKKYQNKSRIVLLLNDYKSYTSLTLEQNWNAAAGSQGRFEGLKYLLEKLNHDYFLTSSYVNYPSFLYVLDKKEISNEIQSFGVWEHHLKDLNLPINNGDSKIISSVLLDEGQHKKFDYKSQLIFNIEQMDGSLNIGDTVGLVESPNTIIPLIYEQNIWNIFSEYHEETPNDSALYYSWTHLPLVSGSIQYSGSFFSHRAHIYKIDLPKNQEHFLVKNYSENAKLRVWITD